MRISLAATAAIALLGTTGAASAENYLVIGNGNSLGDNFAADVEAAGGSIVASYPFGVAVISADAAGFRLAGRTVVQDVGFQIEAPAIQVMAEAGYPPNSGDDDFFFDLQWGHNYVGAQEAWNAGNIGQGVKVAVLDGGFDLDHPDLAPNINLALSADFTGEGLQYGFPDTFSHGTHVAGTIAAADNGFGTIGVAPGAELVLVKVLSDSGSGSFANVIAGIYHAASVGADVINMSLGTVIPRTVDPAGVSALDNAVSQAVAWAFQQGTTTIVSGGNAASDLDGDGDLVRFNSTARHTIEISALTTLNWAGDPDNQTLVPASYTNYGTSGITFSAPGGSVDYPGNEGCVVAGLARPCWVFDLVFSTGNGGWYWSAGTSMAAPHAAGVAALIIAENGGDMHPAQVERELRARSIDLGKPGRDDFYGHGLVNSGN